MLKDQSAIDANLTYLEAESASVSGGPSSDKRWAVYGSPVCRFFESFRDRVFKPKCGLT